MDFAMGWNQFNLTILGVWPEPRETSARTRVGLQIIFWSSTLVTFGFICAPQTVNLLLESSSLDEVIENLSINVPIVFALVKQIVLRYHRKALTTLVGQILEDWSKPTKGKLGETMLRNARISRSISIFCSTLTYLMLLAFVSLQIYSSEQNTSETELGGLLHPATFPYDVHTSPNFEITWLGQLVGTILTAICYSCFDTFLAVLVLHLCGQIGVLRLILLELPRSVRSDSPAKFRQMLGFVVKRHEQLHRFSVLVEECFNFALLGQTLISTAMFCLTGYRMITTMDKDQEDLPVVGLTFFVIHVIYTMLHLFIYCYVGEMLLDESVGVADSAYECEWYDLPPKMAASLTIVIRRARISFRITAGKFRPFSLEFFNAILKTSCGYLSVLLAMKDRLTEEQ